MNDAIRLVLEGASWHAGGRNVAFQACDDSLADTGLWSKSLCKANARAYAADPSVLGVIGTYNSGCAEAIVPILTRAPGGGVAMVSPGNTLICLTQSSPSCPGGQPDGFAQQSTIDLAGAASKGMFASVPGRVPQNLTGPGKKLASQLQKEVKGPVELYAPYAGQAASVLLGAISQSGERSGVIAAVRKTKVNNGIVGSFRILPSGDPSIGPITVSVAGKTFVPVREVEPGQSLVKAARNG